MESDYRIEILSENDEPEIRKLIALYLQNEPTAQILNLTEEEKSIFAETYIKKVVPQGFSLGAFENETGILFACAFHTDGEKYVKSEDYNLSENTPGLEKLLRFDEFMESGTDVLVRNEKLLMMECIIADPKFGRRGLAKVFYERMEELAKSKGFTLLIAVVNSAFTRTVLVHKYDFVVFKDVLYADYRDPVNGEAIFRDIPEPHTRTALVYKRLTSFKL